MMENDNLDKFFKKRLTEFDAPTDGWDKLGKTPFDKARTQFPNHRSRRAWILILLPFLSLIGVTLLSASIYYKHKFKTISNEYAAARSSWETKKTELLSTKVELEEQLNAYLYDSTDQHTSRVNLGQHGVESFEKDRLQLTQEIATRDKYIDQLMRTQEELMKRIQSCQNALVYQHIKDTIPISVSDGEMVTKAIALTGFDRLPLYSMDLDTDKNYNLTRTPSLTSQQWRDKGEKMDFEVGMNLGIMEVRLPILRTFDNQEIIINNENFKPLAFSIFGIDIDYSLTDNWWIGTGLRYANVNVEDNFTSGLIYDSRNETVNANGDRITEYIINTDSPFSNLQARSTLNIPGNLNFNDGDFLQFSIVDYQDLNFVQLPFQLGYKWSTKSRFQWDTYMGIHWNHIEIKNYSIDLVATSGNFTIPVTTNSGSPQNDRFAKQFWGISFGAGLSYRLRDRWKIRLSVEGTENFIQVGDPHMDQSGMGGSLITLGANYSF